MIWNYDCKYSPWQLKIGLKANSTLDELYAMKSLLMLYTPFGYDNVFQKVNLPLFCSSCLVIDAYIMEVLMNNYGDYLLYSVSITETLDYYSWAE